MLRKRLESEDGIAIVVVMAVLLAVSLLALGLASAARDANSGTVRDSSSKRALAAAEAGLQIAMQRYGEYRFDDDLGDLADNECLAGTGGVTKVVVAAGSACPPVTDSGELGDGASFSYVISLPNAPCQAVAPEDAIAAAIARCVTVTGTVQGVRRRLQARLALDAAPPFFEFAGLVGFESVSFQPNVVIGTPAAPVNVGSNGAISLGNNGDLWGDVVKAGPDATVDDSGSTEVHGAVTELPEPFELELDHEFARAALYNNNAALASSGHYTSSPRPRFKLNSGTYTLPADADGDPTSYYFCDFELGSNVLRIPSGSEVRIFIDSSARTGSPCTTDNRLNFNNEVCVNYLTCGGSSPAPGLASDLKVYFSGTSGVHFGNKANFSGLVYAPDSDATFGTNVFFNGALAAKSISVQPNLTFTWPADARETSHGDDQTSSNGWFECPPQANPADPEDC